MRVTIFSFVLLSALSAYPNKGTVDSLLIKAREVYLTNKNEAYQIELNALHLASEINYMEGIVKANYYLGFYFNSQNDLPSSITHYLEAIKASTDLNDSTSLGWALFANMNLGSIFREHQIHDLADEFTTQGILLSERINNKSQNIRLKFNLQKSHREQERFDEALITLDEIEQLTEPGSKAYLQAYNGIGLVFTESEQFEKAISQFKSLVPVSMQVNNQTYLGYAFQNLGEVYFKMNNYQDAEDNYQKSIKIRLEISSENTNILFQLYKGLASLHMELGDFDKAKYTHLKAEALIPNIIRNQEYFYVYDEMSEVYNELGDNKKAMFYSKLFQSELASFLKKQSEIKTASQQHSMRMIVSSYYAELKAQRKAEQTKTMFLAIIVGLSTMLFLFVSYHFASRYQMKRRLLLELERLEWID